MIVRAATLQDAELIADVHADSAEQAYAGLAAPEWGGRMRRRRRWESVLACGDGWTFVAEVGDSLSGFVHLGGTSQASGIGELRSLYVLPSGWGTGVGQALLDRAHVELERRYSAAVLTVLAANGRARRFYERNGWTFDEVVVEEQFGGVPTEVARYSLASVGSG